MRVEYGKSYNQKSRVLLRQRLDEMKSVLERSLESEVVQDKALLEKAYCEYAAILKNGSDV